MTIYKQINDKIIPLNDKELEEYNQRIENQKNKIIIKQTPYINQRKNAYPPIGDQLDMLWHSIDQDPALKTKYFHFYEAIKSVKVKYPKND